MYSTDFMNNNPIFVKKSTFNNFEAHHEFSNSTLNSPYIYDESYPQDSNDNNSAQEMFTSFYPLNSSIYENSDFQAQSSGLSIEALENKQEEKQDEKNSEGKLVFDFVIKYKRDWNKIAKSYIKATNKKIDKNSLKRIFEAYSKSNMRGNKYSEEEDKKLIELINQVGFDWMKISNEFPGRCPLSLRNRYYNLLKYNKIPEKNFEVQKEEEINLNILVKDIVLENPPGFLSFFEKMIEEARLI